MVLFKCRSNGVGEVLMCAKADGDCGSRFGVKWSELENSVILLLVVFVVAANSGGR